MASPAPTPVRFVGRRPLEDAWRSPGRCRVHRRRRQTPPVVARRRHAHPTARPFAAFRQVAEHLVEILSVNADVRSVGRRRQLRGRGRRAAAAACGPTIRRFDYAVAGRRRPPRRLAGLGQLMIDLAPHAVTCREWHGQSTCPGQRPVRPPAAERHGVFARAQVAGRARARATDCSRDRGAREIAYERRTSLGTRVEAPAEPASRRARRARAVDRRPRGAPGAGRPPGTRRRIAATSPAWSKTTRIARRMGGCRA